MLVNKITTGFVIQQFDLTTGKLISQEFIAGDQVDFESTDGTTIEGIETDRATELYHPFNMIQGE